MAELENEQREKQRSRDAAPEVCQLSLAGHGRVLAWQSNCSR
jgi:hypothetical protein